MGWRPNCSCAGAPAVEPDVTESAGRFPSAALQVPDVRVTTCGLPWPRDRYWTLRVQTPFPDIVETIEKPSAPGGSFPTSTCIRSGAANACIVCAFASRSIASARRSIACEIRSNAMNGESGPKRSDDGERIESAGGGAKLTVGGVSPTYRTCARAPSGRRTSST